MTPELEVVCAPDGCGLQPGQRLPFAGTLGRGGDCQVPVALASAARHHCTFRLEKGHAFVEHLASTNGVFVNGVSRHDRVEVFAGDWLEVPWGLVLRVTGAPPLAFDEGHPLLALCLEQPHDEARWRVWADALLEAGHPLGERVARGRGQDLADDAKALGPLARGFVDGGVELEWRHGFIRRAVLRHRTQWPLATWAFEWKALLEHPLARFVEELEVDALSYTRGIDRADREDAEGRIVASVDALARAKTLPLLRSVRFGPSPRPLWTRGLDAAWRLAQKTHPALYTGPIWVARGAWLQLLATPAGVKVTGLEIGAQRKLEEEAANLVGPTPECAFSLEAPDGSSATQVALRLDRENGLWCAEDMAAGQRRSELPLLVNGRRCTHHRMRPHDLLEPAPGLLFRFVME